MKAKTCMEKVIFFVLCLTLACTLSGATIYDRSEILKIMKKVADHHHYSSNSWFDATYYAGIMAAYKVSQDTAYLNLAESWGQSHNWIWEVTAWVQMISPADRPTLNCFSSIPAPPTSTRSQT